MKKLKYLLPLLLVILIIFFLSTSVVYKGAYLAKDLIEEDLPNIQLYSSSKARNIDLHSIKDKLYIINIFASWCNYCQQEKPLLKEISTKYQLPIYGVLYLDEVANIKNEEIKNIYKDILVDKEGRLLSLLGSEGIPETLIIKDSKIIYHLRGSIEKSVLNKDIYRILESLKD